MSASKAASGGSTSRKPAGNRPLSAISVMKKPARSSPARSRGLLQGERLTRDRPAEILDEHGNHGAIQIIPVPVGQVGDRPTLPQPAAIGPVVHGEVDPVRAGRGDGGAA